LAPLLATAPFQNLPEDPCWPVTYDGSVPEGPPLPTPR
jgi:hypothetical protein